MQILNKYKAVLAVGLMAGLGMAGCSSSSSTAPAAATASITGTAANGPLNGATVVVTNGNGAVVHNGTTTATGQFTVTGLTAATNVAPFTIHVSGGTNIVTNSANQFDLYATLAAAPVLGGAASVANVTLFSTLARAGVVNPGATYAFGNDSATCNPDTTNLTVAGNAVCAASILRANSLLAQMVRLAAQDTYSTVGIPLNAAALQRVVTALGSPGADVYGTTIGNAAKAESVILVGQMLTGQFNLSAGVGQAPIQNAAAALNAAYATLYPAGGNPSVAPLTVAAAAATLAQVNVAITAQAAAATINADGNVIALKTALGGAVVPGTFTAVQANGVAAAVVGNAGVVLAGNGQKGPIAFGTVTAKDSAGWTGTTITDAYGNYNLSVSTTAVPPLSITISGGTDTVTGKPQEMPLSTLLNQSVASLSLANANVTPMSTMVAAAAEAAAAAGVPLATALAQATTSVVSSFGFGLDPVACNPLTVDVTTNPTCASQILRANEALGQMMRDTAVSIATSGGTTVSASSMQTVLASLASNVATTVATNNGANPTQLASIDAYTTAAINTVNSDAGTGQSITTPTPTQQAAMTSAAATQTTNTMAAVISNTLSITPLPTQPESVATFNLAPAIPAAAAMATAVAGVNPSAPPPAAQSVSAAAVATVLADASTSATSAVTQMTTAALTDPNAVVALASVTNAAASTQTANTALSTSVTTNSVGGTVTSGNATVTNIINTTVAAAVTAADAYTATAVAAIPPVVVPAPVYQGFGILPGLTFGAAATVDQYGLVSAATSPYNNVAITFTMLDFTNSTGSGAGAAQTIPTNMSFYVASPNNAQVLKGQVLVNVVTNPATGAVSLTVPAGAVMQVSDQTNTLISFSNVQANSVFTTNAATGATTINLSQWLATAQSKFPAATIDLFKANPIGTTFNYELGFPNLNIGLANGTTKANSTGVISFFNAGSASLPVATKASVHGTLTTQ